MGVKAPAFCERSRPRDFFTPDQANSERGGHSQFWGVAQR